MTTSATSHVKAIKAGGSLSRVALADYGLDSNPHFNNPDQCSRDLLFFYYSSLVIKYGVTAETFHEHLKAKTLHELLGTYFKVDELKNVLVDGRVKNVYESF